MSLIRKLPCVRTLSKVSSPNQKISLHKCNLRTVIDFTTIHNTPISNTSLSKLFNLFIPVAQLHVLQPSLQIVQTKSKGNFELPEITESEKKISQGKYQDAEELLERAHSILSSSLGAKNSLTFQVSSKLFHVLMQQRRFSKAQELAFSMLTAVDEKGTDSQNRLLADALKAVISCYTEQQKLDEALGFCSQLLEVQKTAQQWIKVAESLVHMGALFEKSGELMQADTCYQQAMMFVGKHSTKDENILLKVCIMNNLGSIQHKRHLLPPALKFYEQALDLVETLRPTPKKDSKQPTQHPTEISAADKEVEIEKGKILANMAELYLDMKEYFKAEDYTNKALGVLEYVLSDSDPLLTETIFFLAKIYQQRQQYVYAEGVYHNLIGTLERSLPQAKSVQKKGALKEQLKTVYKNYIAVLQSRQRRTEADFVQQKLNKLG